MQELAWNGKGIGGPLVGHWPGILGPLVAIGPIFNDYHHIFPWENLAEARPLACPEYPLYNIKTAHAHHAALCSPRGSQVDALISLEI